jgi:hypothetical protein
MNIAKIAAAVATLACAGLAHADDWTMHMTCDNQFGLYFGSPTTTTLFAGGGTNWQTTYTYTANNRPGSDYIYVSTSSDRSTAQGLIGDFTNTTLGRTTVTGDAVWQVFPAGRYLAQLGFTSARQPSAHTGPG